MQLRSQGPLSMHTFGSVSDAENTNMAYYGAALHDPSARRGSALFLVIIPLYSFWAVSTAGPWTLTPTAIQREPTLFLHHIHAKW